MSAGLELLDDLQNFANLNRNARLKLYETAYAEGVEGSEEWDDYTEADAENICITVPLHPRLRVELHSRDPGIVVLAPDHETFKGDPRALDQDKFFDLTNGNRNRLMAWMGDWQKKFPAIRRELTKQRLEHGEPGANSQDFRMAVRTMTMEMRNANTRELALRR